ncbi:MAG: serine/threonine-protein phosphatase [Treponema sp.]|nr:serine/threonine-protein phosphatase [Treponema sp.]
MVYIFLNAIIGGFLIWFSYYIDRKTGEQERNPLVTMNLLLAIACFGMASAVLASFYAPQRLTEFLGRVVLIITGWYSLEFCTYCVFFPSYDRPAVAKVIKYVLLVGVIALCFHFITSIDITAFLGFNIMSLQLFTGSLAPYLPLTWFDLYKFALLVFFPVLSVIIMLLRSEMKEARLEHQKVVLNLVALVSCWITLLVLHRATGRVPLFATLFPVSILLLHALVVHASVQNVLYDWHSLSGVFLRFAFSFFLPAALVGSLFPTMWSLEAVSPIKFLILMVAVISLALTFSYQISKILARLTFFRSAQYAETFEKDLATLDYSNDPEQIVKDMREIFKRNIALEKLQIYVNNVDTLENVYLEEGEEMHRISTNDKVLDSLMNQNRTILLRSALESGYNYGVNRAELLALFEQFDGDAVILLNEGRHLLGALSLGKKNAGNIYSDYDQAAFTKLYSYFFVFGYYMKNIANQSVVGTVNREIRMSAQIITSIQENMDPVKNPKIDAGYIMRHAHNIGGEFVDLIRLSDTRHIFVLGDLSGKGISASMSMVIVKSIIRTFLAETKDFKLLVEKVNQFIRFNLPKGTFFEGVFGLLDFNDNMMYYINCGIPALFVYTRAFNNVIEVQGDGRVLGFVKDIGPLIKVKKLQLNPGDIVVTCSDGLIDCQSLRGERFGKDRVQKAITENAMYDASKMSQFIFESLTNFISKGLDDDVSILVLKCLSK